MDSPLKSNGYVCAFCSRSFQTAQRTATCHALWFLVSGFFFLPFPFVLLHFSFPTLPTCSLAFTPNPDSPTALPLPAPIFKMSALSSTRPIALHEKRPLLHATRAQKKSFPAILPSYKKLDNHWLIGTPNAAITSAGSMFATLIFLISKMLIPIAIIIKPPTAVTSASIASSIVWLTTL